MAAERIGFYTVPAHHCAAYIKPELAALETTGYLVQKINYLLLIKIHQHTFGHKNKIATGMFCLQNVQPVTIQQRSRNVRVSELLWNQLATQCYYFGQIHVVKNSFATCYPLATCIKSATYVHHDRIGMAVDETPNCAV